MRLFQGLLIAVLFHHRLQPFQIALDFVRLRNFLPGLLRELLPDDIFHIFTHDRFG